VQLPGKGEQFQFITIHGRDIECAIVITVTSYLQCNKPSNLCSEYQPGDSLTTVECYTETKVVYHKVYNHMITDVTLLMCNEYIGLKSSSV